MAESPRLETFDVNGGQILDMVKSLIHEGNVRRIVIKQEGRTVIELPLSIGVVGVLLAPTLAAVGAVAALLTQCTIEVERADDAEGDGEAAGGGASGAATGGPRDAAADSPTGTSNKNATPGQLPPTTPGSAHD